MFDFNLTRIKGRVKVVNTFELTFVSSQRYMQRRNIFDVFLMRIKCVVKNVIIFDLIFDTNQKRANPIFRAMLRMCTVISAGHSSVNPGSGRYGQPH